MTRKIALVAAIALGLLVSTATVRAQDETARAAALFASGNQHLQAAQRARGERRTRELEAALRDYAASLAIVRSRNVLFNAALALEQLGRRQEAFDHLVEYLAVPGLSETERAEASRRLEALRAEVAVLSIRSAPPGAEVWVDRRDLPPRGRTPLEVAVAAGPHRLWLRAPGHREAEASTEATVGTTSSVDVALEPEPVSLQVLAPTEHRLLLDGAPITAGAHVQVAPGTHTVRLEIDGVAPIERRFEVLPGAAPMVIDLAPAVAGLGRQGNRAMLTVRSAVPAQVLLDGLLVGGGSELVVPVPPGEHDVEVVAEGRQPFRARRAFAPAERTSLDVELSPRGGGLTAPRAIVGPLAALAVLGGAGVTIAAVYAHEDALGCDAYAVGEQACNARADEAESLALATDITWGIGAALGLTALALLVVDDSGPPSTGRFSLAPWPLPSGGGLAGSLRFGGAP